MKKEDKQKKPFFARFLESQELEEVTGGSLKKPFVTLKYPSDDDEGGNVTLKYPSDGDEGGIDL